MAVLKFPVFFFLFHGQHGFFFRLFKFQVLLQNLFPSLCTFLQWCLCILSGPSCCWPKEEREEAAAEDGGKAPAGSSGLFAFLFVSLPALTGGWRLSSSPLFYTGASKPLRNRRLRNSAAHTRTHSVKHAQTHRGWWKDEVFICWRSPPMVDITVVSQFGGGLFLMMLILHQIHGKQNKAPSERGLTLSR